VIIALYILCYRQKVQKLKSHKHILYTLKYYTVKMLKNCLLFNLFLIPSLEKLTIFFKLFKLIYIEICKLSLNCFKSNVTLLIFINRLLNLVIISCTFSIKCNKYY